MRAALLLLTLVVYTFISKSHCLKPPALRRGLSVSKRLSGPQGDYEEVPVADLTNSKHPTFRTDEGLESLFSSINDIDPKEVPEDIQDQINQKLSEGAPPDWKVRMNIMGFTPLTIAGYALAFMLIALNSVFGYGWASRLLGFDDSSANSSVVGPSVLDTRSDLSKAMPFSDAGVVRYEIPTLKLNSPDNLLEKEE